MTELTELEQPGIGMSFTRDEIAAWKCPDLAGAPKAARRVGVITYIRCPTRSPDEQIVDIEDINSSGQAVGEVVRVEPGVGIVGADGYLWSGGERTVLPEVAGQPAGNVEPHAINDRGEIVGHSFVGATLWTIK
jgi:hypothetical protein